MMLAPHEQEFAAKQSNARCTSRQRRLRIFWQFDIGKQFHFLAIQCHGRGVQQPIQTAAIQRVLTLAKAVLINHHLRRIHENHAGVAVDHDPVVVMHQMAGAARADHGRNAHAARNNRGMAVLATHIGHKTLEHALPEMQHIGRRQVVRNQHQRRILLQVIGQAFLRIPALADGRLPALKLRLLHVQTADDPLNHLFQIGLALPQVRVLHLVKLPSQTLELVGQGPARVVQPVSNPVAHAAEDLFILQQHHVHIQQRRQLARRVLWQGGQHELHFLNGRVTGAQYPGNLVFHFGRFDEVMLDLCAAGNNNHRTANRNAAADTDAVNGNGHAALLATNAAARPACAARGITPPPRTCLRTSPQWPAWPPAPVRPRFRARLARPILPPASSPP